MSLPRWKKPLRERKVISLRFQRLIWLILLVVVCFSSNLVALYPPTNDETTTTTATTLEFLGVVAPADSNQKAIQHSVPAVSANNNRKDLGGDDKVSAILMTRASSASVKTVNDPRNYTVRAPSPSPILPLVLGERENNNTEENKNAETVAAVIYWTGIGSDNSLMNYLSQYWDRNLFCEATRPYTKQRRPVVLNLDLKCHQLFRQGHLGTGNYLTGLYGMRLAAAASGVTLHWHCRDALNTQTSLVIPWLMGHFSPNPKEVGTDTVVSPTTACAAYNKVPLALVVPVIQSDLRRMAVALLGIPSKRPEIQAWVDQYSISRSQASNKYQLEWTCGQSALVPNITLDDAVIHFRCGDLMNSNHKSYGFLQFESYARHVPRTVSSIGILTQPFTSTASSRPQDYTNVTGPRCQLVVEAFVKYLQQHFPRTTRITIRQSDTLAVAYARIVLARVSVSAMSSFAVFPMAAMFGKAHLRYPGPPCVGPYQWIKGVVAHNKLSLSLSNHVPIHLFHDTRVLLASQVLQLWQHNKSELLLKWFQGSNGTLIASPH